MKFTATNALGGLFKCKVYRADGTLKQETPWSRNLVLNSGLSMLAEQSNSGISELFIGTGSSVPVPEQTQLDKSLASTTNVIDNKGGRHTVLPYYLWARNVFRFAQGAAKGNITEMGLGRKVTSDTYRLFNRVLVRDMLGEPTAITVLDDEYLEVTVEIRMYFPDTISGQFNLVDKKGGIISTHKYTGLPCMTKDPSSFTLRAVKFDYNQNNTSISKGTLGTVETQPTLRWATATSTTTYPSTYTARATIPFGLDQGNTEEHKCIFLPIVGIFNDNFLNGYQWELDIPITKTNTQLLNYICELKWVAYTGDLDATTI